jgi:hypothetical protein
MRPLWRCSTALHLVPARVPAEASTPCTLRLRFPPGAWSMRDGVGACKPKRGQWLVCNLYCQAAFEFFDHSGYSHSSRANDQWFLAPPA